MNTKTYKEWWDSIDDYLAHMLMKEGYDHNKVYNLGITELRAAGEEDKQMTMDEFAEFICYKTGITYFNIKRNLMKANSSRKITSSKENKAETVENFPEYMVGYAAYGEDSLGVTDEDIQNFEKWRKRNGYGSLLSVDGDYGYFSSHPAFGLACDVVPVTFSVIENSRRPIKSNATDDVRQIALFIENDGQLYRQMIVPVIKNLERKVNKGNFDKEKALIAWQHVADEGTKKYNKEFGSGKDSVLPFNTATRKEVAKRLMEYYEENYMGDNPITSSKENKAKENGPHMKFKKLDPDKKAELREQIEDELEARLNKLHVKFDVDTWNNTVEYILSFFEEDNGYNPKDAKTAVYEWYLDTKEEFPEMFEQDAGKKKIASALYNSRIHGKLIGSARKPIKSVYDANTFAQIENAVDDLQNKLSNAGIKIEAVYNDYFEDIRCKVLSTENLNPIVIANMNDILQEYMKSHPNIAIETEVNDYFYGRNIYVLLADEYYIDSSKKSIKSGYYDTTEYPEGAITSAKKLIKSSKSFTKNGNWKYNTAVLPSSKSMLKSFFEDGSWSWDDTVALVGHINGGRPYVIFGAAGKYPSLEKGRGLYHDQTLNDIGWFTFERYCNDDFVFNIPQARYAVLK